MDCICGLIIGSLGVNPGIFALFAAIIRRIMSHKGVNGAYIVCINNRFVLK